MEVNIGDFGRMMFEIMTDSRDMPKHWKSIKDEAQPLIQQLIALNRKMKPKGYTLVGFMENGKKLLGRRDRIDAAVKATLEVKVKDLKAGDRIWFDDIDGRTVETIDFPIEVEFMKGDYAYVDFGDNQVIKIHGNKTVLKAPADITEDDDGLWNRYPEAHWLAIADSMGI